MDNVEKVKELVRKECEKKNEMIQWEHHVLVVHKYAMELAKDYDVNKEVLELSVWLHDITRIEHNHHDHNITGAKKAEEVLSDLGYSKDVIEQVKHCVISHMGKGSKYEPKSIEAKILSTADALTHFDTIPLLLYWKSHLGFKDLMKWIDEKIERGLNEKILIPKGKEIVKEKYDAYKKIFERFI
jgi:uncharacterized protein